MRRVIAILLALLMLTGTVPVCAFASEVPQETFSCDTGDCTDEEEFPVNDGSDVSVPAAATVYLSVSSYGELVLAYAPVSVSDINRDGRLSVEEALQAAHSAYGKGYASVNGTVTKLWGVDTANISIFVNHRPASANVCADTVSGGDYLVLSVDRDTRNDYDKYSRFDVLEKHVEAGIEFTLTLTDEYGTALAGMELGLSDGNGNTIPLGLFTDGNGRAALVLNQEGTYCVTAKGSLVEQSYNLQTGAFTAIETPVIAPVCVVKVNGTVQQHPAPETTGEAGGQDMVIGECVPITTEEEPLDPEACFYVDISTLSAEIFHVIPPEGEGFVFSGEETAAKDSEYRFTLSVTEEYDGSHMTVKVNEETVSGESGVYTVPSVSGDLTITVEGIIKLESADGTLPTEETISEDTRNLTGDAAEETAETVDALINAIGEVTVESKAAIEAARAAYESLSEEEKALVENLEILIAAEAALAALEAENADREAAKAVEELITAIGEVSLESEPAIQAAREAYEALTDTQKAYVTNYGVLVAAEETLRLLKLSNPAIYDIYQTTGNYLRSLEAPIVGSTNGEWRVIGLARGGQPVPEAYYETVIQYVSEYADGNNRLHRNKSTENARVILALTALGKDVTDVSGKNLLSGLNEMAYIGKQGINGTIWALIAFDSHGYAVPAGDVSREKLVQTILDARCPDGGWSLAGTASDPDMTGMALTALAPYYAANADVKNAVDKALDWLSGAQRADGTFGGSEGITCESLAQVVTALTTLGLDPENDSRFVKNGVSVLDALASFYVAGGGFRHELSGDRNMMATEQGYYALVAYYRFLQKQKSLYDMSDVTIETSAADQAAADVVIGLIHDIGEVDLSREDAIKAARAAYDALTDAQKELVTNYETLTNAENALAQLKQNAADTAAANTVKALIDAIGTVTLDKEEAILAAREAYNALTQLQKDLVGEAYRKKLTDAESELAALKKAEEDRRAAQRVIELINNIGTTITLGSEAKISTARNAYNALTADQKALVTNYQMLLNAEAALNLLKSTVTVTFSLLGCYEHGAGESSVHTLAGGNLQTWIPAKTYRVQPGSTVKDLFEQALTAAGLSWRNPTGNYVEAIKYRGVWIEEFTNGQNSGWMYTRNGKHPNLGVAQQTVVNGDVVVFHYTDDFTKEEGSTGSSTGGSTGGTATGPVYSTNNGVSSDLAAAEAVENLIEDIDDEITLDSEAKILAARAAYDKLSDAQKKLVKNYDVLVAAEAKLAQLKGGTSENVYLETGDYLQSLGTPGVGATGGEWMVIGLARSGREVPAGYYDHVLSYVRENIDAEERLHRAKSSDNARLILAMTAIGKDVTDVDGHNLLQGLNSMDYLRKQGINGPIWALIAFDCGNYPVPEGDVSREKLLDVILSAQLSDGGWALSGERSDPDMTGMAIQALAPYMESHGAVQEAVEKAVQTLSGMQNDNGSFSGIDGPSSESIAQVIVALCALGIDADADERFVKNGISALDALLTYYVAGGGFRHVLSGNLDGMATEQAYYAMVAYDRMMKHKNFLYDMTDVIDAGGDVIPAVSEQTAQMPTASEAEQKDHSKTALIWIGVMSVCFAVIGVLLLIRKKFFGKFL